MGLKGYTFDRMKISPKADALLYYSMLDGNDRIVKGYKDELKVVATGLNTYISPGACIVQGRMIEIDEEMQLSVSANDSGYVCIVIDLTQNNTSTGEAGTPEYQPVNNQLRLEVVKELVQQDLHNAGQLYTFPLASFTSTGTTVTLTKINHNQRIVESGSNENGRWTKFADGTMICQTRMILGPINASSGTVFQSSNIEWQYPQKFINSEVMLSGFIQYGTAGAWIGSSSTNSNPATGFFRLMSYISTASTDIGTNLVAHGRWK